MPAITFWSSSSGFNARDVDLTIRRNSVRGNSSAIGSTPEGSDTGQLDGDAVRVEHNDLAESSRVDKPHLSAAVKMHHDVGVRTTVGPGIGEQHLSAHPEMHHQHVPTVKWQQQVLAPRRSAASTTVSVSPPISSTRDVRPHDSFAADFDAHDALTHHMSVKPATHSFDPPEARACQLRVRQATSAATCSAAFLDRPAPLPISSSSTVTVAVKTLA